MNARDALGRLLRTAHTEAAAQTDAQVLVEVLDGIDSEYELVCLLAVLSRLAGHAMCSMAGIRLGELNLNEFLAREATVEAILSRVFDQYEGGPPQG